MTNKEQFIEFIKHGNKSSFGQNRIHWLKQNGFEEFIYLVDGYDAKQIQENMLKFAHGMPYCKFCGKEHNRMPGLSYKLGWSKTCSEQCRQRLASDRQNGDGNSSHRMTIESKNLMKSKMSTIMKKKILLGEFTPKSENYLTHKMIEFKWNSEIRKVRSLWEMIYWVKNPNLEYETIRIKYYDRVTNTDRIYITDFYDKSTNTIIEVKPKKYQQLLVDKRLGVKNANYNYLIIDEDYFNTCKTDKLYEQLKEISVDFDSIKKRLKWIKKVK